MTNQTNTQVAANVMDALNVRISNLVRAKVESVFGTDQERSTMRAITVAGIKAGEDMLEVVNSGLTYETWKAFLVRHNAIDGPLGIFENTDGELAKIVDEFMSNDFEALFEEYRKEGVFEPSTIQATIDELQKRLNWLEQMWAEQDDAKETAPVLSCGVRGVTDVNIHDKDFNDVEIITSQESIDLY